MGGGAWGLHLLSCARPVGLLSSKKSWTWRTFGLSPVLLQGKLKTTLFREVWMWLGQFANAPRVNFVGRVKGQGDLGCLAGGLPCKILWISQHQQRWEERPGTIPPPQMTAHCTAPFMSW